MPDSSLHSHTHLGIFCTMSIWFLLHFNLPVLESEKNAGQKQEKEIRVMDETEVLRLNADLIRVYSRKYLDSQEILLTEQSQVNMPQPSCR